MLPATLVVGATGFIGTALVKRLVVNQSVICWVRDIPAARQKLGDHVTLVTELAQIEGPVRRVFNLAGAPIMDKAWDGPRKKVLTDSRVSLTESLVTWMAGLKDKPEVLVQGSAVGYYPVSSTSPLDETSAPGTGFLAELSTAWEQAALKAESLGVRVVLGRTSMVLGEGGGALTKIVPPFRAFVGGPFGSGKQWMPWIHLFDHLRALELLSRDTSMSGVYNLCSPNSVTSSEFAHSLGAVLHRPSLLKVPGFVLKLLLGPRSQMLLGSQQVEPKRLLAAGFVFSYPHLDGAFTEIFS